METPSDKRKINELQRLVDEQQKLLDAKEEQIAKLDETISKQSEFIIEQQSDFKQLKAEAEQEIESLRQIIDAQESTLDDQKRILAGQSELLSDLSSHLQAGIGGNLEEEAGATRPDSPRIDIPPSPINGGYSVSVPVTPTNGLISKHAKSDHVQSSSVAAAPTPNSVPRSSSSCAMSASADRLQQRRVGEPRTGVPGGTGYHGGSANRLPPSQGKAGREKGPPTPSGRGVAAVPARSVQGPPTMGRRSEVTRARSLGERTMRETASATAMSSQVPSRLTHATSQADQVNGRKRNDSASGGSSQQKQKAGHMAATLSSTRARSPRLAGVPPPLPTLGRENDRS